LSFKAYAFGGLAFGGASNVENGLHGLFSS